MTSASKLPTFTDYLVALSATSLPTITCYDGPPVTQAYQTSYIAIGWDGVFDASDDGTGFAQGGTVATIAHDWNYLGSMAVAEQVEITCAVVAWNGGTDVKTVRDLAWGYLSTFEQALRNALRTDSVLQAMTIPHCIVSAGLYDQVQQEKAVAARIEFTVQYQARI